jgi:hypothetical protein
VGAGGSMSTNQNQTQPKVRLRGQSVLEYLIVSALVGILCIAAMRDFGGDVRDRIKEIKKKVTAII